MTQVSSAPVVKVKARPNIYTLMVIVAIVLLAVTIGLVLNNLMTVYGMSFEELFTGQKIPLAK